MNAECARQTCAQQASVLLAYDPKGATAWLRDLGDAHPSMGLMLCRDHAETTSVPMSWQLVDERSDELEFDDTTYEDPTPPSFDDIFPPRAAPEPDPYGMDHELEVRQPAMTAEETEDAIANDPDVAPLPVDEIDEYDYEAVELLAPELSASGTDGAVVGQPQLPMISTPPTRSEQPPSSTGTTPAPDSRPLMPGASVTPPTTSGAPTEVPPFGDLDFLFEEHPDESLAPDAGSFSTSSLEGPVASGTSLPAGPAVGGVAEGDMSNGQVVGRRTHSSPLFGKTDVSPKSLSVPTSAPLLSRAFRTAQFE